MSTILYIILAIPAIYIAGALLWFIAFLAKGFVIVTWEGLFPPPGANKAKAQG